MPRNESPSPAVLAAVARVTAARSTRSWYAVDRFFMEVNWRCPPTETEHREVVALLRSVGWWVGRQRDGGVYARWFRDSQKSGAWGGLRCRLATHYVGGSDLSFYVDGDRGTRYGVRKWDVTGPTERRRFVLTATRLAAWLTRRGCTDATEPEFDSPYDVVEYRVRRSGHYGGEASIWEPRRISSYEHTDADGNALVNGQRRLFYGWRGHRLRVGEVFHNLNAMWWVVSGGEVHNVASHDLHGVHRLGEMRRRGPQPELALKRLRLLLQTSVARQDFERAVVMRDVARRVEGTEASVS